MCECAGECNVEGIASDADGSVIVAGTLFGWLEFPRLFNFTVLEREYYGSIHKVGLTVA